MAEQKVSESSLKTTGTVQRQSQMGLLSVPDFSNSFNGTWVNGNLVGCKNRVMLRNKDEIQLFKRKCYPDDDPRQKCKLSICMIFFNTRLSDIVFIVYRVLFPPVYEANVSVLPRYVKSRVFTSIL